MHMSTDTEDYVGVVHVLAFTSNDTQEVHIPILQDTTLEGTESFTVELAATIDSVHLVPYQSATVLILDNTMCEFILKTLTPHILMHQCEYL